jgi:hypothetical protein
MHYLLQDIHPSPSTKLFVLADQLHGYTFRPLGGNHQAIKIHKSKITIETPFFYC